MEICAMADREIIVLPDAEAVARQALGIWQRHAAEAVAKRKAFRVLLSGGSTPKRLFQLLAEQPVRDLLPWSGTHLFWGDERAVPPDHKDSNYRMTREAMLDTVSPPAAQVHRLHGENPDLAAAATDYQKVVAGAFKADTDGPPPAFDLVFLGMGTDAHTASLFPGTRALGETRAWFVANEVPQLNTRRLTATYPLLNAARAVVFLAAGHDKAEPLGRVLAPKGETSSAPSRGISPAGSLAWVIDKAAAAGIPQGCALGVTEHAG